jgi:hypothetical protein
MTPWWSSSTNPSATEASGKAAVSEPYTPGPLSGPLSLHTRSRISANPHLRLTREIGRAPL